MRPFRPYAAAASLPHVAYAARFPPRAAVYAHRLARQLPGGRRFTRALPAPAAARVWRMLPADAAAYVTASPTLSTLVAGPYGPVSLCVAWVHAVRAHHDPPRYDIMLARYRL